VNIEISNEMAIELADAYAETYGGTAERLVQVVGALLVYIPDPRGSLPPHPAAPVVERVVRKPKGKLTPHQREVYDAIVRTSRRLNDHWVEERYIGSKNACDRLIEKGWIMLDIDYGPRGGERRSYRPITEETR
jgi:hypothetical protein